MIKTLNLKRYQELAVGLAETGNYPGIYPFGERQNCVFIINPTPEDHDRFTEDLRRKIDEEENVILSLRERGINDK